MKKKRGGRVEKGGVGEWGGRGGGGANPEDTNSCSIKPILKLARLHLTCQFIDQDRIRRSVNQLYAAYTNVGFPGLADKYEECLRI